MIDRFFGTKPNGSISFVLRRFFFIRSPSLAFVADGNLHPDPHLHHRE
jgi:hypothetical protein